MDKCSGHECRKIRATTCSSCGWNKEEPTAVANHPVTSSQFALSHRAKSRCENCQTITKLLLTQNKTKMGQQLTFTPTQLDLVKEWAENFLQNPDLDKTKAGNMAAGVRVRKELFQIMKLAKSARKEVTRRKHIKKSKKKELNHV